MPSLVRCVLFAFVALAGLAAVSMWRSAAAQVDTAAPAELVEDAGTPAAAPVPAPDPTVADSDPAEIIENTVEAARTGQWRLVAAGVLSLLMWMLRRAREHVPWFAGERGGALLVMLIALGTAVSAALATSVPIDWRLFLGAVAVAWTAVGGYHWFRRILWPDKA